MSMSPDKSVKRLLKNYAVFVSAIRTKKTRHGDKEYIQYLIYLPKQVGENFYKEGDVSVPILVTIRPAEWYHLLDWSIVGKEERERLWKTLDENARKELCELGIVPEEMCGGR